MTSKHLALITVLGGYNDMAMGESGIDDELLIRIQQEVVKYRGKLKIRMSDMTKANFIFQKLKDIDADGFTDRGFSPMVMVLLILEYLTNEEKVFGLRGRFVHFGLLKLVTQLESVKDLRKDIFVHHKVLTKMIEV